MLAEFVGFGSQWFAGPKSLRLKNESAKSRMAESVEHPVSVLIPTKDEERNIADCVKNVSWAGEIFVYDSMSSDGTIEIAEGLGANVVQRSFDNFADHKNWALDNLKNIF